MTAKEVLSKMSIKEKIGQLNQQPLNFNNVDKIKEMVKNGEVGSLILATSSTAGNDEQQKAVIEVLNEIERIAIEESPSGIPVIFGRDVIHGHNTVLPVPLALSATFNPTLVHDSYRCIAKEASNDGVQWTFSPMIDISRDPRWGRCIEGIGEDPYLGMHMAKAVVTGFQGDDTKKQENIAACAKHYIGYGAAEGGRDYGKSEITDYTLRNYYLKPFKSAVDNKTATVMNSFNEIGGVAPAASRYLLHDLLKDELGFDGYVISDWGAIEQLINQGIAQDKKQAAELAINAGIDMDMCDNCYPLYLEELINEGKVSIDTVDDAVLRILTIKEKFGLLENPYIKPVKIDIDKHEKMAENCSDEAMVLLKNKDNTLPLSKDSQVYVTGPMAHEKSSLFGSWVLDGDISRVTTIADALKAKNANTKFDNSEKLWDNSLLQVHFCDAVVLVLGESKKVTGEGNSLSRIELPSEQLELVKKIHAVGKKVIGVMCFGRPIALENSEMYFDAIVYAWHSGTRTAQSVASILYGDVNPSGKLPMTFPRCTGQIPIYYNQSRTARRTEAYYNPDAKYDFSYHDCLATPMYPFGYGLSYTNFEYGQITADNTTLTLDELENGKKFKVSITVKNTGAYDGKETVQCYIHDTFASMARPLRELKGFSKQFIKKGEQKTVAFELGFDELAFYNQKAEFKAEKGEFEVFVGTNCYASEKVVLTVK